MSAESRHSPSESDHSFSNLPAIGLVIVALSLCFAVATSCNFNPTAEKSNRQTPTTHIRDYETGHFQGAGKDKLDSANQEFAFQRSAPLEGELGNDGSFIDITIIHTGDEHGWLKPVQPPGKNKIQGGAANFRSWIFDREEYDPESHLLLSSGDNWTGAAVSTWHEGRPMVEAFNLMGYDAIAVGNHEFDFGRTAMLERFSESWGPYLGANIIQAGTRQPAFFANPYTITEKQSVKIGIIGLANRETHSSTHPLFVMDLDFKDYAETLEKYVPMMRNEGSEIVIVVAHECRKELKEALATTSIEVDAVLGAHCHDLHLDEISGVPVSESGWALRSYTRLTLRFDPETRSVTDSHADLVKVEYPAGESNPVSPDPEMAQLVDKWYEKTSHIMQTRLGYSETGISRQSWAMANWITDSWLHEHPQADASVVVFGGMRQFIGSGPITMGDVFGMLPFENSLVILKLSGRDLSAFLHHGATNCETRQRCYPAVGGIRYELAQDGFEVEFLDGRKMSDDEEYTVIITDFMYFGGSGYPIPPGTESDLTGLNWREAVVNRLKKLNTTPASPLEKFIDPTPRNRLTQ